MREEKGANDGTAEAEIERKCGSGGWFTKEEERCIFPPYLANTSLMFNSIALLNFAYVSLNIFKS